MIRLVERCEIDKCVEVIRESFLTVAQEWVLFFVYTGEQRV